MDDLKITIKQWSPQEKEAIDGFYAKLRRWWDTVTLWYNLKEPHSEAGAQEFRDNMKYGGNGWPKRVRLDDVARDVPVPTRSGKDDGVYLRVLRPDPAKVTRSKGVYMHMHAGGWVLGAADIEDEALYRIANNTGYTVASVQYRLAPRYPFPAAVHDCVDAARYLLTSEAEAEFGSLRVIGGESAGAHLTMTTVFALRELGVNAREQIDCLVYNYGVFDVSETPSARAFKDHLVIGREAMQAFHDAFVVNGEDRKDPKISPLYEADWSNLPPAVFVVGTNDPLYDDTLFAAIKWRMGGNDTEVTVFPGSYHGLCRMGGPDCEAAMRVSEDFILKHGRSEY